MSRTRSRHGGKVGTRCSIALEQRLCLGSGKNQAATDRLRIKAARLILENIRGSEKKACLG